MMLLHWKYILVLNTMNKKNHIAQKNKNTTFLNRIVRNSIEYLKTITKIKHSVLQKH